MITCQACGTINPPEAAFCSKCARKLDPETQQKVVETRAAHTATGIRWTMVLLAALIVLIILVLVVLAVTHL
jgi:uncharacterized membrane protein YvbJ